MLKMKERGIKLNLGESNSVVVTGGGWKIFENRKVPLSEFVSMVEDTLGVPSKYYVDVYGMSEMNGLGVSHVKGVISISIHGYIQWYWMTIKGI
jgi:hypothetical protein